MCSNAEANAGPGDADYCLRDCCTIDNDVPVSVLDGTPYEGVTSIAVQILTDNYPTETSYSIKNLCNDAMAAESSEGSYSSPVTTYMEEYCVPVTNRFEFTINDSWGDGICCAYGSGSVS